MRARETLNVYFSAGQLLLKRLLWDGTLDSWKSRRFLKQSKGKHEGQACVICCNGPSLLKTDFDLLKHTGTFCIGLNKIHLLFERTDWRPQLICCCNPLVLEQAAEFYNSSDIPLYLDSVGRRWIKRRSTIAFLHSAFYMKFARDVSMSYFQGGTVTFMALQVAFHLGFSRVALVGCDHSFSAQGPANATVSAESSDKDHFDPRYFGPGLKWQLPDLVASEFSYDLARRSYEEAGRLVVNATAGGRLEIFQRMRLDAFLDVK